MGKTPFELRLDVLSMAKDMLEKEHRNSNGDIYPYPKTEDITAKADELYAFVNTSSVGTSDSRYANDIDVQNRISSENLNKVRDKKKFLTERKK